MMSSRTMWKILRLFFLLVTRHDCFQLPAPPTTSAFFRAHPSNRGDISSPLMEFNRSQHQSSSIEVLQAAASITRESYRLLGVKSVGIDYGLKRTGIATTVGYNPKPLTILSGSNSSALCEQLVDICRIEQAKQVVVGLPLHKNGTEAEQTNLTRIFAVELANKVFSEFGPGCPVLLWDERYTSKEAAARVHS